MEVQAEKAIQIRPREPQVSQLLKRSVKWTLTHSDIKPGYEAAW